MTLYEIKVGDEVTRPIWDTLSVKKIGDDKWQYFKEGKPSTCLKDISTAFDHNDYTLVKSAEKIIKKEKKMGTDLLGEALLPIIQGAVDSALDKADFEAVVKSEIAKAMGSIPQKTLTIIDTKGVTKEMKLVHKQFEMLLKLVNTKRPILLKGEAGTAKSHNVEAVAEALSLDFYSMSVGEQSTKSDLLGFIDANGNYRSTAFRKAFEQGGIFLLDEIDAGNPNVLLAINTGISNGFIDFPDTQIKAHDNFRLIATANTFGNGANGSYVGRNKLDKATVNRFIPLVWELDEDIEEVLVNHPQWLKVLRKARKIASSDLDEVLLGMRNAMYGADMLRQGIDFDDVFNMAVCNGLSVDDIATLSRAKDLWKEPTEGKKVPKKKEKKEKSTEVSVSADEVEDEFSF
jgi:MoxR-like ATPase